MEEARKIFIDGETERRKRNASLLRGGVYERTGERLPLQDGMTVSRI